MKKKIAMLAAVLSFAGIGNVYAADAKNIDLDETIQLALENNRVIKQAIASRENAYWTMRAANRRSGANVSLTSQGLGVGGSNW